MRSVIRGIFSTVLLLGLAASGIGGDGAQPAAPGKAKKDESPAKAEAPVVAPLPLLRPAPTSFDEAMRRLSRVRVSVAFKDMRFEDAVEYVRHVAGFNVLVAPALAAKGTEGIRPLTMTLHDVSLRQLVELVAQFSGAKLKFEDGILQFTTVEDARGKPVLRIYAIGDVTMPIRNFPAPDINLRPHGMEFEQEQESETPGAWSDPQKIVDLIQKTIAEDSWADKDVSISADANKLIVKQYPEVHRQIARLIGLLRASR
jgi:hypothetical protein